MHVLVVHYTHVNCLCTAFKLSTTPSRGIRHCAHKTPDLHDITRTAFPEVKICGAAALSILIGYLGWSESGSRCVSAWKVCGPLKNETSGLSEHLQLLLYLFF